MPSNFFIRLTRVLACIFLTGFMFPIGFMLPTGFGSLTSQAGIRTTRLTYLQDSAVRDEIGSRPGDSTRHEIDTPTPIFRAYDSREKKENPADAASTVVPPEWKHWIHSHQYIPKDSTQKEGYTREGKAGTATISFLLLTLGLLLIAADRQRFVLMVRAFLIPRLFEQILRQQSSSLGSGWAITRVVYFLILMASCTALYRYRMQQSPGLLTLDGFYIFGMIFLATSILLLVHLLVGLIFNQIEWTINHVQTTWVYLQCSVPILLFATLLTATLPTSQLIPTLCTTAALLMLGWIYRLILGWIRAFHNRAVGLGYIIFYFCTFEILPLLLLLKYATVYLH